MTKTTATVIYTIITDMVYLIITEARKEHKSKSEAYFQHLNAICSKMG